MNESVIERSVREAFERAARGEDTLLAAPPRHGVTTAAVKACVEAAKSGKRVLYAARHIDRSEAFAVATSGACSQHIAVPGGALCGRGFDLIVIDRPAGFGSAWDPVERAARWISEIMTRRMPGGGAVILEGHGSSMLPAIPDGRWTRVEAPAERDGVSAAPHLWSRDALDGMRTALGRASYSQLFLGAEAAS